MRPRIHAGPFQFRMVHLQCGEEKTIDLGKRSSRPNLTTPRRHYDKRKTRRPPDIVI